MGNKYFRSKGIVVTTLVVIILCQISVVALGAENTKNSKSEISSIIEGTINYIYENSEDNGLSQWQIIGIASAGRQISEDVYEAIEKYVEDEECNFRKITDYAKIVMAVTALNGDPGNVAGYDILDKIYNNESITLQGTNGPAFALIALDTGDYIIPKDGLWTRERLVEWILKQQNTDGGFPLVYGDTTNIDITAMVIQSLSKYRENLKVAETIEKALEFLSSKQSSSGGYETWGDDSSESISQVIIALAGLGIDLYDQRFVKEGNLLGKLLSFKEAGGGFSHIKGEGSDNMATEQALVALVAYRRFLDGQNWVYTMKNKDNHLPDSNGIFAPKDKVTREMGATVIVRIFERENTSEVY